MKQTKEHSIDAKRILFYLAIVIFLLLGLLISDVAAHQNSQSHQYHARRGEQQKNDVKKEVKEEDSWIDFDLERETAQRTMIG